MLTAHVDEGGNGMAVEQRLYQLIRQPKPTVDRRFEIEFHGAGVETFAFTFGRRLALNQLRNRGAARSAQ